jgi:gliding motility-associated-like protein
MSRASFNAIFFSRANQQYISFSMNKLLIVRFWAIIFALNCLFTSVIAQNSAWRCYVNDFSVTPMRVLPFSPPCNYVSGGIMQLPRAQVNSNAYFNYFTYTNNICLSENFQYEVRIRAGANVGGIPQNDVGLILNSPLGEVAVSMMSNSTLGQPFTFVSINGLRVFQNSPLLVRDFTNWSVIRLTVRNRILELSHDNTVVYTAPAPLPVNICSLSGYTIYFKGSGMVDYVKFTDLDNNRDVYNEDFSNCNNMAAPLPCLTPSVNLVANPVCEGDTLKIINTISPQPKTVAWTGPNSFAGTSTSLNFPNATRALNGTYTLKADYSACLSVTRTVDVLVNTKPRPNLGRDTTYCAATSVTLNPSAGAGTYRWNIGTSNPTLTVFQSGTYSVTVTNGNGCRAADTVRIDFASQKLTAQIEAKPPTCFGNCNGELSVLPQGGLGAPYRYKWLGTSDTTPSVKFLCAGDYGLTVTDAKGCTFSTVTSLTQPEKIKFTAKADSNYNGFAMRCGTDTIGTATASATGGNGGFTFLWQTTPVQTTPKAINMPVGSYKVIVTDAKNCTDSLIVHINAPPRLETEGYETKNVTCFGDKNGEIRLGKTTGGTKPVIATLGLQNLRADSAYIFKGLTGGSYPYLAVDANGCQLKFNLNITEPPKMIAQTSNDTLVRFGDDIELFATLAAPATVGSVKWKSNRDSMDLDCKICKTTKAKPRKTTIYEVTLTDNFGCSLRKQIIVQVDKNRRVFVPTAFSPNDDSQNDRFCIFTGSGTKRVVYFRVYSRWGSPVYEKRDFIAMTDGEGWDGKVNGNFSPNEVYVWVAEIEFEDGEREIFKGDVALFR